MPLCNTIKQLRRDPAPQLAAQAALEEARAAWSAQPVVATALQELAEYGAGAGLEDCGSLMQLACSFEAAASFVQGFVASQARVLRQHPLGHVPFRHQYGGGIAVMQFATAGRAALALLTYEDRGQPAAQTVCFAGGERHEICLAGDAEIRILRRCAEGLAVEHQRLTVGDRLSLSGSHIAKLVDRPLRSLTVLRLSRTDSAPPPAHEYRIADGSLVHVASGNRAESAAEMAMAVLGAMRWTDVVAPIAAIGRSPASDHLRWQALRQLLALDTATGFGLLTTVALDPADPLAASAGALRALLVEAHPVLAKLTA